MNQNTTDIDAWIPTIQTLLEGSGRVQVIWDREYLEVKEALTKAIEADNDFLCDKLDVKAETDFLCYHLEEFSRASPTSPELVWFKAVMHIICALGTKWYLRDTVVKFFILIGPKLMAMEGDHEEMFFIVEDCIQAVTNTLEANPCNEKMIDALLASSYLIGLIEDDKKADNFVRKIYELLANGSRPMIMDHFLEFFMTSGIILRDARENPVTVPFEPCIDELFDETEETIQKQHDSCPSFQYNEIAAKVYGLQQMLLLKRHIFLEEVDDDYMEHMNNFIKEIHEYLDCIKATFF